MTAAIHKKQLPVFPWPSKTNKKMGEFGKELERSMIYEQKARMANCSMKGVVGRI